MKIYQAYFFVSLCQCQSFTKAAQLCHVSQPALTRAIGALEAELGGALFHRSHARSQLTRLGELVRPHLEQIVSRERMALAAARALRQNRWSMLRLGLTDSVGIGYFSKFIGQFRRRRSDIAIAMSTRSREDIYGSLRKDEIDVAVTMMPPLADERLCYTEIYREALVVTMPAGHALERKSRILAADLEGEMFVGPTVGGAMPPPRSAATAEPAPRHDWIQAMIAAGAGIAILPESAAMAPGVVARSLAEPQYKQSIALVTLPGTAEGPSPSLAACGLLDFAGQYRSYSTAA